MKNRKLLKTISVSTLLCASSAFAVNGAYDYGFSEITRGMAGAGSALPQDTLIAAINPAGMVDVGKRVDIGAILYFPTMSYDASAIPNPSQVSSVAAAPGRYYSSEKHFLLPDFGMNFPIDRKSAFGVSMYSLGGFGTKFRTNNSAYANIAPPAGPVVPVAGPLGDGTLLSDLKQAATALTYSRHFLNARSSWGISLLMGFQMFRNAGANGLASLSAHSSNLSGKGTDYSAGVGTRLGFLFNVLPTLDLSASYQPKVYMSKFHRYKGLFPNGGEFDYPAFGNIGLAWHVESNVVLAADVEKIWFTDISNYGHSHNSILPGGTCPANQSTCLGGSNGAGFGWSDDVIYKLGLQWAATAKTTLRAGFQHGQRVLNSLYATENMITPGGVIRNLFSAGITEKISKKDFINGAFTFIPLQGQTALNQFSGPANQNVRIEASGWGVGASWSRILD
jgi:long-chain fatty acid transport protein